MALNNSRSSTGWWIALGAVVALAAAGFYTVLSARFDIGEGYPNYSTLRADPLGARAMYEALGRIPHVASVRSFERIEKLEGKSGKTLILLNVGSKTFNEYGDELNGKLIARWASNGGRVVIAIDPQVKQSHFQRLIEESAREVDDEQKAKDDSKKTGDGSPKKDADSKVKKKRKKDRADDKSSRKVEEISLAEALQVTLKEREFTLTDKGGARLTLAHDVPLSPQEIPLWFSNVSLDDNPEPSKTKAPSDTLEKPAEEKPKPENTPAVKSPWHTIAHRGNRAMIMERKLGAGSVVICTDSFFASNEALWNDPKSKFISWLVGDARRVIFDETHLGSSIGDEDSLMTLARRYGMHGLFIGGLLLFALYVWRNSASLVPPDESRDLGHWRADAIAGMSAASGLEGMLWRGIPRKQILRRCFETWDGTSAAASAVPAQRRAQARAEVAGEIDLKNVPAIYRKLRDIIHPPRK